METFDKWFMDTLESQTGVSVGARPYYLNWVVRFLGFCRAAGLDSKDQRSLEAFLRGLPIGRLRKFQKERLEPPFDLCGQLLYGCGLRLQEVLRLRVQDLDFALGMLVIYRSKGGKSRRVPLPARVVSGLHAHLEKVKAGFEVDLKVGFSGAFMPDALDAKYPGAAKTWPWQWVFPGDKLSPLPDVGQLRRSHLSAPFRNYWATQMSEPPKSMCMPPLVLGTGW